VVASILMNAVETQIHLIHSTLHSTLPVNHTFLLFKIPTIKTPTNKTPSNKNTTESAQTTQSVKTRSVHSNAPAKTVITSIQKKAASISTNAERKLALELQFASIYQVRMNALAPKVSQVITGKEFVPMKTNVSQGRTNALRTQNVSI